MWQLIGLILFGITYYVYKRTYHDEYDSKFNLVRKKVSSPLWVWILIFIVSMLPGVNIIGFFILLTCYITSIVNKLLYYKNSNKFINKIIKVLNYEV